jgi:DNA-binding transcriptional ArsR family regulator
MKRDKIMTKDSNPVLDDEYMTDEELFEELKSMDKPNNNQGNEKTMKEMKQKSDEECQNKILNIPNREEINKKNKKRIYNDLDRYNPYREDSSMDLGEMSQSFRWIETDVLLQLIQSKLSSSEWSVFFYILHLTRGHCNKNKYYKTIENIPMYEIEEYTKLSPSSIRRSIKSLEEKHIIYRVEFRGIVSYGINFRCDTWISNNSV